jgi:hypothetical protein
LFSKIIGKMSPVLRTAVHVIEIAIVGNSDVNRTPKLVGWRDPEKGELHGATRGRRDSNEKPVVDATRSDEQRGGSPELYERSTPDGISFRERRGWQLDAAEQFTGFEDILMIARDEIDCRNTPRSAATRPKRESALERHDERCHRSGGQR